MTDRQLGRVRGSRLEVQLECTPDGTADAQVAVLLLSTGPPRGRDIGEYCRVVVVVDYPPGLIEHVSYMKGACLRIGFCADDLVDLGHCFTV